MVYAQVLAGLLLLLVGGDIFVRGAVGIARRLAISPLLIGLTLVGFGTSLPELVASLEAARVGSPGVAVGNVVGSNIANILLILGLSALIAPIAVAPGSLRRDGPVLIATGLLTIGICWLGRIDRWWGLLLLVLLLAYMAHAYLSERRHQDAQTRLHRAEADEVKPLAVAPWPMLALTLSGLAGIVLGAGLLVDGAIALARAFAVSETVIGLTIVAIGTSLPELATSVIAALRRHGDVALGNVVGSNIFNLLGILGATALFRPIPVPAQIAQFDNWVMLAATVLFIVFAATKSTLERWEGGVLLAAYAAYVALLLAPSIVAGGGFALAPA
jgi:cation:H+ antiporter